TSCVAGLFNALVTGMGLINVRQARRSIAITTPSWLISHGGAQNPHLFMENRRRASCVAVLKRFMIRVVSACQVKSRPFHDVEVKWFPVTALRPRCSGLVVDRTDAECFRLASGSPLQVCQGESSRVR